MKQNTDVTTDDLEELPVESEEGDDLPSDQFIPKPGEYINPFASWGDECDCLLSWE